MDTPEFESLLADLDRQIVEAKKVAEIRAKRDAAEKQLKRLRVRIDALQPRIDEIRRLGAEPDPRAERLLSEMREEERSLTAELERLGVTTPPAVEPAEPARPTPTVSLEEKQDVVALLADMAATDLDALDPEEREVIFRVWALRWRLTAEDVGQDRVNRDSDMRKAYARLREAMDRHHAGYIPALSQSRRDPRPAWERQLGFATREREDIRARLAARRLAEQKFQELVAFAAAGAPGDGDEKVRRFRHLVRDVAKAPSMRDDLAELCAPHRTALGEEFVFLWSDDEAAPAVEKAAARLNRRDIVARVLRRMISKAAIGGCHVPLEKLYKGFPSHDQSRAKEALDLLEKIGVLRIKSTEKGPRASLEPAFVTAAEGFVAGGASGYEDLEAWCAAAAR